MSDDLESYLKEIIWFRQKRRKEEKYKSAKTWLKWTQNTNDVKLFSSNTLTSLPWFGKIPRQSFLKLTSAKNEPLTFCTLESAFHTLRKKTIDTLLKIFKISYPYISSLLHFQNRKIWSDIGAEDIYFSDFGSSSLDSVPSWCGTLILSMWHLTTQLLKMSPPQTSFR